MQTKLLSLVLSALLTAACATTSASAPVPPATAASADVAPTPYTAEQIRQATPVGRTYEFRIESPGKPAMRRVITFTRVAEGDAEMTATTLDGSGKPIGEPKVTQVPWEELRKHAEFPKSAVTIDEQRVTVPIGTFDCIRYTVKEDAGEVTQYYFAKNMPGAPVLFLTDKDGQRVMASTLVRYVSGK
jgi:hypothetical protein